MRSPRRRDLLGLTAGSATALLAGCLSDSTGSTDDPTDDQSATSDDGSNSDETADDGTSDDATTDDEPAASDDATATVDGVALADWAPSPDATPFGPYFAFEGDVAATLDAGVSEQARSRLDRLFVPIVGDVLALDEVSEVVALAGRGAVATHELDAATVRERLESMRSAADGTATAAGDGTLADDDTQTATAGTVTTASASDSAGDGTGPTGDAPEGYEGYATAAGYCWLGADHVLFGTSERVVSAMHATATGDAASYVEDDALAASLDAVGEVDLLAGRVGDQQVEGATALAYGWTLGDPVEFTAAFAFESASEIDVDAVSALAERPGLAEYDDTSTTTDGRVVSITGSLPLAEFDLLATDDGGDPGGAERAPQVAFEFEFEQGGDGEWDGERNAEGGEKVRITHSGGDSVDLDRITVQYDGTPVSETAVVGSEPPEGETWTAGGEWVLTDATTNATFESGAEVLVVWTAESGDAAQVLAMAELP